MPNTQPEWVQRANDIWKLAVEIRQTWEQRDMYCILLILITTGVVSINMPESLTKLNNPAPLKATFKRPSYSDDDELSTATLNGLLQVKFCRFGHTTHIATNIDVLKIWLSLPANLGYNFRCLYFWYASLPLQMHKAVRVDMVRVIASEQSLILLKIQNSPFRLRRGENLK